MNQKELQRRLRDIRNPAPPPGLRDRLESGIPDFQEQPERRWGGGSWTMMRIATVTATAAVMIAAAVWIGIGPGGTSVTFAAALDPVLQATDGARAVHVVLRMLTREGEDFSYVNLDGEPRTVEAWIEWPQEPGDKGRARVDKTDRIYVHDGTQSVFYHPLRGEAYKGSGEFGHGLFWPAAWVRQIRNRPNANVDVLVHEEIGNRGRLLIREKGAEIAPLEPSFLGDFDRETEVAWALDSNLLSIDYLPSIDDAVFELQLPESVRWGGVPEAPVALLELGPREVALRFFDAALDGDREQLELFCGSPSMVDWLLDEKRRPTEILYIGEPFHAGDYPGVYVPYKVRFGTGWFSLKEFNLALRNDNDQHRWVFDGGI